METPPPNQPGLLLVSFSHVTLLKLLSSYRSFTKHPPHHRPSGTCQHYSILPTVREMTRTHSNLSATLQYWSSGLTQNTKANNCMGESQYIQPLMLPQTQTIAPPILPQWTHTPLHMTARPAVSERLGQTIQTGRVETQIQTAVFLDGPESSWTPALRALERPSTNAECQTNKLQIAMGVTTCAARWGRRRSESPEGMEISPATQPHQGNPEVPPTHPHGGVQGRGGRARLMGCVDPSGNERNSRWPEFHFCVTPSDTSVTSALMTSSRRERLLRVVRMHLGKTSIKQ